jgi:hypothetical protein
MKFSKRISKLEQSKKDIQIIKFFKDCGLYQDHNNKYTAIEEVEEVYLNNELMIVIYACRF